MNLGEIIAQFTSGFLVTLSIFAITLVVALPFGLLISFCSMSKFKPLSWLTKTFVWIIRGTPLMLQIIAITFIPSMFNILNKDLAGAFGLSMAALNYLFVVVAFAINYACYFSEIFRGGIQSISKGQYEAGQVLGMKKGQIFNKIVLLQVIKRILPPMSNEVITLVKDTSLARIIGVMEIIMVAQGIVNVYVIIWPLFFAGLFYLIFNGLLTILFNYFEKKLSYFKV